MKFKIYRYDKTNGGERFDTFELETKPGMTVLTALFHIQDTMDDTLSFRYSCRGAVCGNCAMLINKVPRLACRTQLDILSSGLDEVKLKPYAALEITEPWNSKEEILIEPLPHLPIIKDLIVDMNRFFEYYRTVQPYFKAKDENPDKERLMERDVVTELEKYTNCILCATCVGSCPVNSKNEDYLGPAALAKLYRFHIDPRENDDDSRLMLANNPSGWWGCEFHGNCKTVCPKDVPPNLAIGRARQALKKSGKVPEEINGKK